MCICPESHSMSWRDALTHPEEACWLECGVEASSSVKRIWPCPGQFWENEGGDLESTSCVLEAGNLDTVRCGQASPGKTVSLAGCGLGSLNPTGWLLFRLQVISSHSCIFMFSFAQLLFMACVRTLTSGIVLLAVVCVLCLTDRDIDQPFTLSSSLLSIPRTAAELATPSNSGPSWISLPLLPPLITSLPAPHPVPHLLWGPHYCSLA